MTVTRQPFDRIAVFCGARTGVRPQYVELAKDFGAALARRGAGLVYGAGGVGVMGAVADAVLSGGAPVTGVIPHRLYERERPQGSRGELFVVRTMHERKALMYKLSKGFAVLPGGLGTLDELMEVATWNQLGFHQKPIVLVNHEGFFDPLAALLDHVVKEGFLSPQERSCIDMAVDVEEALDLLGCTSASVAP
ncbi:TIGR00730 family Rossman fold protein (plasmid) [Streptomyces viridifaciens]|nr:TIGR00730 family Rossman fold protein [Streptomyces viridifaciens]